MSLLNKQDANPPRTIETPADLEGYQRLLKDLDQWVDSTHGKLKKELPKFTSVGAVLKEMDSSKVFH